jgi:hypothetical protein
MQKVDAQTGGHVVVAVEREKRVVHRIGVLTGQTARWCVGVKCAAVAMRRDTEPGVILQGVVCGTFSGVGVE